VFNGTSAHYRLFSAVQLDEDKIMLNRECTRNSSGDETANVNFNHFKQCAPEATEFGEITQNEGHYAVQVDLRSPILVPIESPYTTSY